MERMDVERLYYTPREVSEILGISDDAVLRLVRTGDLPALRVSARVIRIPIIAFDRWREGFRPRRRRVVHVNAADDHRIGADERLPEASATRPR
ncbi:MAG: helix-turn-helix domain-containing protein [Chloroflexota bacterium]